MQKYPRNSTASYPETVLLRPPKQSGFAPRSSGISPSEAAGFRASKQWGFVPRSSRGHVKHSRRDDMTQINEY
ncbi:hypothetical protein Barb4_02245 [Bacteroidales bacterium Barb4]|nr:hypothetical protein Barb4_02245 [Bacteroidales bacterium Barb4]